MAAVQHLFSLLLNTDGLLMKAMILDLLTNIRATAVMLHALAPFIRRILRTTAKRRTLASVVLTHFNLLVDIFTAEA